mmetsp:Transcript_11752/g.37401  ORF Transcript_11752/g.37401 Transcript_11752/m.37401 type:complete len:353 (-) Transcript_11752:20-1078(-)
METSREGHPTGSRPILGVSSLARSLTHTGLGGGRGNSGEGGMEVGAVDEVRVRDVVVDGGPIERREGAVAAFVEHPAPLGVLAEGVVGAGGGVVAEVFAQGEVDMRFCVRVVEVEGAVGPLLGRVIEGEGVPYRAAGVGGDVGVGQEQDPEPGAEGGLHPADDHLPFRSVLFEDVVPPVAKVLDEGELAHPRVRLVPQPPVYPRELSREAVLAVQSNHHGPAGLLGRREEAVGRRERGIAVFDVLGLNVGKELAPLEAGTETLDVQLGEGVPFDRAPSKALLVVVAKLPAGSLDHTLGVIVRRRLAICPHQHTSLASTSSQHKRENHAPQHPGRSQGHDACEPLCLGLAAVE